MSALAALTGPVGIGLAAAAAAAGTAAYFLLGKQLDSIAEKIEENHKAFKESKRVFHGGGFDASTFKELSKEAEVLDTFLYNATSELEYAIPTATQKAINKFKEMNDSVLNDMKLTMEDIKITLIEGVHGAVKKISRSLAEAVVFGKDLVSSFKAMAQGVMVKIIAHLIEQVALMAIQKFFKLEELDNEAKKDNLIRKQNTNLKRQIVYQSILAALGGGGSFLSTSGGSMKRASGGSVQKGQPYMVGENGAEMFVPNQSGQIQQSARGGSGGGSTTVNFNINTVDARGFDELLTQSRGTITQLINQAVNERGAKSII
jgi:hypothetical protein